MATARGHGLMSGQLHEADNAPKNGSHLIVRQ
jgi:hypothetical protein